MRVLLINTVAQSRVTAGDYHRFLSPMPPITLAYLAAALEQAGVTVAVHDEWKNQGDLGELERAIRRFRPHAVCLSVVTAIMPATERIAREIRERFPRIPIVMGNIHADLFFREILEAGLADVVVHGEGEETIVELMEELSRPSPDLSRIQGISFVDDGVVQSTEQRPFVLDLDTLPFPAWHLFPMERYRIFNFARVREPGLLILGSRGCPFGCTYCSLKIMGQTRRRRSAANIVDEIEYIHDRFGVVQPSFTDPIFPFSKREGNAFAEEILRRGLEKRIIWITETRVDLVDGEMLRTLAASGLKRIMFGFETGDSDALDAIKKGHGLDAGREAVRAAHDAGVEVIGFFMLGIPGSTTLNLQATIDYAVSLDIDFAKFTVFVPFPGTVVHDELLQQGKLDDPSDWRRYTSYPTRTQPPIYVPDDCTVEDIIRYQRKAYRQFYLRPHMILHQLFKVRTLSPRDMVDGLRVVTRFRS